MISVGITGQSGFIGSHLYNYLGLKNNIVRIPFEDNYFNDNQKLKDFVKKSQVIVQLAAMNRHDDPQVIYDTNIKLVKQLLNACDATNCRPYIIFASSIQEERDNLYGKSKLEGRILFERWSVKKNAHFTALLIPNVFGPFGKPHYNSVIATFCHQLVHNEEPKILVDGLIKLIYVNELVEIIYDFISGDKKELNYTVPHTSEKKVSEILNKLITFRNSYNDSWKIPDISDPFNLSLFNTFRSYIPYKKFPVSYSLHSDERGSFVEAVKTDTSGQFSFSITEPGVTRGNHFHIRKVERFIIVQGSATVEIRKIGTKDVVKYELDGKNPSFVDIPVWHTHNLTNIGNERLVTCFWINEPYDPKDADTFYEITRIDS